ncbi:unnamed protein product, partial [Iphiclides podalirius]
MPPLQFKDARTKIIERTTTALEFSLSPKKYVQKSLVPLDITARIDERGITKRMLIVVQIHRAGTYRSVGALSSYYPPVYELDFDRSSRIYKTTALRNDSNKTGRGTNTGPFPSGTYRLAIYIGFY